MFTLEESALLGRMLRVMGWLAVCLSLGIAGCAVVRLMEHPRVVTTHHSAPAPSQPHHS